jgi:hypothetical protein
VPPRTAQAAGAVVDWPAGFRWDRGVGGGAVASGASIARVTAAGSRRRPGELCGVMGPERLLPIGQVSGTA